MKNTEEKIIIRHTPKSAEEKAALLQLKMIQDVFTSKEFVEKLAHWRKHERPKWIAIKEAEKMIHTFLHTPKSSHNITHNDLLKALETIGKANRDSTSPKKGKKFPIERTYKVTYMLELYWAEKLPEGHNRKSWFHHIADTHGMSFDNVKKIEDKYRPPHFKPKR